MRRPKNVFPPRTGGQYLARLASDVRSDSGYEIGSGRGYPGGVNPRLQGPWSNRYRARRRAQRRRQPEYGRITKPIRYT